MLPNVTVLGDSRVFDTYYVNARYAQRYGYDQTFPHLWRKRVLGDPDAGYDVVHIPDHFRGGSVQNNIVRVALTDPAVVVIMDGIWDTLLNRRHFIEYVERQVRAYDRDAREEIDLTYSPARLVELFRQNELSISPKGFAERLRTLVSYFRRRRRQAIVMTVPVPPKDFVGATYHAGDYRPFEGWDECLREVEVATRSAVEPYGAKVVDLTALMMETGGASASFIDQWHFSPAFHARLAEVLDLEARTLLPHAAGPDHVSHEFMLGPAAGDLPDEVAVYTGDQSGELDALAGLGPDRILVYPREVEGLDNPRGDDRAEFQKQSLR